MQSGLHDAEKADSLSLFLETAGLTYCLYKDSERILGNTFGMCVLQVSCKLCVYAIIYYVVENTILLCYTFKLV